MKKKTIAYASGSRADYGIVRKYIDLLNSDDDIDFSILVTGSHLEDKFGLSIEKIVEDGFNIAFKAKLNINNTSNEGVLYAMSSAISQFAHYFEHNKYDLLIILGDRYEMMAVAIAAAIQRIPILHLHGGEITLGNYDEFIRHCISKMSSYHFTSTPAYRNRVIQMGERPENVCYLGSLGAENCREIDITNVDEWIKQLPRKKYFVIAFHPETLTDINISDQVNTLLSAIELYNEMYKFVFIGSNADTGGDVIRDSWIHYADNNDAIYVENLHVDSYLYLVKNAIALIGNSSSGIIEAPSLETFSINIGDRQKGRIHGDSVIDCSCELKEIRDAIDFVLSSDYTEPTINNPYYVKNAAESYYKKTKDILSNVSGEPKQFFDINFTI